MLVIIPAFPPSSLTEVISLSSCPVHCREPAGDHVIKFFYLLNVCSPETPRRVLCLPGSEQPVSWLCASSLDSTPCGGTDHRARGAALLKWHLHSQLSLSKSCLFYLFQEAHAGGSGGQSPGSRQRGWERADSEVMCYERDWSRGQACPHTLRHNCTRKTHFGPSTHS